MDAVTISDGTLAVPAEALERAGLRPGDHAVLEPRDDGLLIRRRSVGDEIDEEIAAGRVTRYGSDAEFDAALRERLNPLPGE